MRNVVFESVYAYELALMVRAALHNSGLGQFAHHVTPDMGNFARLPIPVANEIAKVCTETSTRSHKRAWLLPLASGPFAIKVYEFEDFPYWHIAIVHTGWRRHVDWFLFRHHWYGARYRINHTIGNEYLHSLTYSPVRSKQS